MAATLVPRSTPTPNRNYPLLQAAMMGLLALLLAFSFAMAESRFEIRQQLVIDEANAISDAWMFSRMLPDPYRAAIAKLLSAYADARVAYYQPGIAAAGRDQAVSDASRLQDDLWAQAIAVAAKNPNPVPEGLFVSALNNVFDYRSKRDAARQNHVPEIVLYLLFIVATVSMGIVGFGCGVGNSRHLPVTVMVAVLIGFVILVIIDLDRPRRGFIEVNQATMLNLRHALQGNSPVPP